MASVHPQPPVQIQPPQPMNIPVQQAQAGQGILGLQGVGQINDDDDADDLLGQGGAGHHLPNNLAGGGQRVGPATADDFDMHNPHATETLLRTILAFMTNSNVEQQRLRQTSDQNQAHNNLFFAALATQLGALNGGNQGGPLRRARVAISKDVVYTGAVNGDYESSRQ